MCALVECDRGLAIDAVGDCECECEFGFAFECPPALGLSAAVSGSGAVQPATLPPTPTAKGAVPFRTPGTGLVSPGYAYAYEVEADVEDERLRDGVCVWSYVTGGSDAGAGGGRPDGPGAEGSG